MLLVKNSIMVWQSYQALLYFNFLLSFHAGQAVDVPLSETGLQQAEAAGCYLRDVKFTNVFASDLLRAKQVRY